jgi:hypothetical protein
MEICLASEVSGVDGDRRGVGNCRRQRLPSDRFSQGTGTALETIRMGSPKWGEQPWFKDLYPGDDVVNWIAEDPYSIGSNPQWRSDFAGMVDRRDGSSWQGSYTWATTTHPSKPIMLAEWGVTEDPANSAAKANFFTGMPTELRQFPAIKALVYWSSPGSQPSKATSIDTDPAALAAFRLLAAGSEFRVAVG